MQHELFSFRQIRRVILQFQLGGRANELTNALTNPPFGHLSKDIAYLPIRKLGTTKQALASWQASEESACLFLLSYLCDDSNLHISIYQ